MSARAGQVVKWEEGSSSCSARIAGRQQRAAPPRTWRLPNQRTRVPRVAEEPTGELQNIVDGARLLGEGRRVGLRAARKRAGSEGGTWALSAPPHAARAGRCRPLRSSTARTAGGLTLFIASPRESSAPQCSYLRGMEREGEGRLSTAVGGEGQKAGAPASRPRSCPSPVGAARRERVVAQQEGEEGRGGCHAVLVPQQLVASGKALDLRELRQGVRGSLAWRAGQPGGQPGSQAGSSSRRPVSQLCSALLAPAPGACWRAGWAAGRRPPAAAPGTPACQTRRRTLWEKGWREEPTVGRRRLPCLLHNASGIAARLHAPRRQ